MAASVDEVLKGPTQSGEGKIAKSSAEPFRQPQQLSASTTISAEGNCHTCFPYLVFESIPNIKVPD
jgi:hypothetical protein